MNMEHRLLHSLIDRKVYDKCSDIVRPSTFSEDLQDIAEAIIELHGDFDQEIDLSIVQHHLMSQKVSTTAKKSLLNDLIEKIGNSDPIGGDIAKTFIYDLARKDQRLTALNQLARIIEQNEDSHESVLSTLSRLPEEEEADGEIVSPELADLAEFYSSSGRYPFHVPILQARIGGMGKGNLAIIFGRPEVGKSSFVAGLVGEYIKAGITVEYYANEEPGRKIMLNIRRAVTGEDDAAIAKAIKTKKDLELWQKVIPYLTVRQIGAMSIETVMARTQKNKPQVVILDQVDKLDIAGKHDATHERLGALYQKTRELAKTCDCLVINVSQASAAAEGQSYVTYSMLANSKTGKPGEADIILGLGKAGALFSDWEAAREQYVTCTISKNKINGYHGSLNLEFNAHTNQWRSADE